MNSIFKTAIWMSGAIVSFSAMAVAGRMVSAALDTFEIMMYRSLIGVIIIICIITATRRWEQISRRHLGLHVIRNIAHFTGQNLWFFALTIIPLTQVFALEFTSPLWVLLLSPLLLKERLTRIRVLAAIIGFVGILIVTRPTPDTINIGLIAAAIAAIGFALTAIFTKRLTKSEAPICILFYLVTMQAVFGMLCAGFDGQIAVPDMAAAPWVLLIAIAGLFAHFCLINALAISPAIIVVPMDFVRLPVIAVIGMWLYFEPIDMFVVIGAVIIFAGNYLNIWAEMRHTHEPA